MLNRNSINYKIGDNSYVIKKKKKNVIFYWNYVDHKVRRNEFN